MSTPAEYLDPAAIRQGLSISRSKLSRLLRVSERTLVRWELENRLPRNYDQRIKLSKMKEISELGLKIYTPDGLQKFLNTPLPIFDGRTGFDMILLGEYDRVIGALAADYEGVGF